MSLAGKVVRAVCDGTFFRRVVRNLFLNTKICSLYAPVAILRRVRPRKVVMANFAGMGFADNPKYIAERLHGTDSEWEIVWLVDFFRLRDVHGFPDYVRVVDMYSFAALREYATARFWIDDARKTYFPHKKKTQIYIQTWHGGIGPKKIEADVMDRLDKVYVAKAKKDSSLTDLCISGSALLTGLYKRSFWYSGEVLECGSPRNDVFFGGKDFSWVKERLGVPGKKLCLYAPTFRNDFTLSRYTIDYDMVRDELAGRFGGEWAVAVRLHPNFLGREFGALPRSVIDVTEWQDTQELLAACDCVITDYSSLVYDFMLTGRPVFLFATDLQEFTSKERSLNFSLDSAPFPLSQSNGELADAIRNFRQEDYETRIADFSRRFGVRDDGHASERVVQWMLGKKEE